MNTATKATGAAALLATMVVVTIAWLLKLYGVDFPEQVASAWQGGLTLLFGYLIHNAIG